MSAKEVLNDLLRMKEISITLLKLDLETDQSLDELSALQLEQEEIRDKLNPYIAILRHDIENGQIIQDCIELERMLKAKLLAARNEAHDHIIKIQAGARSKSVYTQNFYQTEGYFIDDKK